MDGNDVLEICKSYACLLRILARYERAPTPWTVEISSNFRAEQVPAQVISCHPGAQQSIRGLTLYRPSIDPGSSWPQARTSRGWQVVCSSGSWYYMPMIGCFYSFRHPGLPSSALKKQMQRSSADGIITLEAVDIQATHCCALTQRAYLWHYGGPMGNYDTATIFPIHWVLESQIPAPRSQSASGRDID